mmetsp:Transcript_12211/g.32034  ORF Transcript_12211/g.32034 Transcript_12211/m.32034 type:complete len:232 (+) Transcript_12211:952-1647(+)
MSSEIFELPAVAAWVNRPAGGVLFLVTEVVHHLAVVPHLLDRARLAIADITKTLNVDGCAVLLPLRLNGFHTKRHTTEEGFVREPEGLSQSECRVAWLAHRHLVAGELQQFLLMGWCRPNEASQHPGHLHAPAAVRNKEGSAAKLEDETGNQQAHAGERKQARQEGHEDRMEVEQLPVLGRDSATTELLHKVAHLQADAEEQETTEREADGCAQIVIERRAVRAAECEEGE